MRRWLFALVVVIVACTQSQEVPPQHVESPVRIVDPEPVIENQVIEDPVIDDEPLPESQQKPIAHEILIQGNKFVPNALSMMAGEEVVFKSDDKPHQISCYVNQDRIAQSSRLQGGEYKVIPPNGKVLCVDAIYGARLELDIASRNTITGNVVSSVASGNILGLLIVCIMGYVIVQLWRR